MDAGASWLAGQAHGGVVETFAGFATSLSVIPWWIGGFISRIRSFILAPSPPSLSFCFSNVDKVSTNPPEGFSEGRLMIWRWVPLCVPRF
jgi:hypothetical protein